MTTKTILSVGQCRPDQAAITHFLTSHFDVTILTADLADDAVQQTRSERPDLVLINRKLDADYSDGMEIIQSIKSDSDIAETAVMLVSNLPEWQEKAVEVGATYGFGKAELSSAAAVSRISEVLGITE